MELVMEGESINPLRDNGTKDCGRNSWISKEMISSIESF